MISDNPSDGSPAGENDGIASGTFKIDDNDDFSFRLDDLSAAPTGMVYALWASNTDEGRFTSLGVIPAGELVVEGSAPGELFSEYTQAQLSLEPESNSPPESPGRVFLSGDLSPAAKDFFLEITTPPSIAPVAKAEEQAGIASEHITYLFEALDTNNLALAKRHAEHIVNTLEGEGDIVELLDSKSWVAENLKITFRKNTTNTPTTGYVSLSDADNIVFDSGSVDVNEKSRISRMTVYWDKIVTGKYSDEMSYRRLDIAIDPDAETNYGDPEEKAVKCRWIDPYVTLEETVQQFVKNLAVRRIQRCKHAQNLITVKVAEKDAGVKTGDYVRLSTDELLEADGLPVTARMYQVVKRDRGQREVTLTLIQVTTRRMAVIGPAGLPAYPIATEVQRAYGFIADSTGRMSDGTEWY